MRDYSRLLDIANNNNGYIFTSDLVKNKISKSYLKYAVEDKIIEKWNHGVYITDDCFVDNLYILQMMNKKMIYSAFTSAYLLDLTTRDSGKNFASLPLNYNSKKLRDNIIAIREKDELYNLGIMEITTSFGNRIKVHDYHRTICDLFSTKYKGDKFVQVEALKEYLKSEKKNLRKLNQYATLLGVEEKIRARLEVLL